MDWGAEIPLDVSGKPDWLPEYLPIVRIARSALVPPTSYYPAGLNRGEWAATKAIRLPVLSDLYKRPEVRALIAGTTAPIAETTAAPDLEARVKALEADVAALKARG
jgi:transglutaminase-like putative cysteine protease